MAIHGFATPVLYRCTGRQGTLGAYM
jgi:hypothetical protein